MSNAIDATVPVTSAVIDHARHREEPEPDSDATEHADRELQPAVEEDERDAERQQELGARRVERDVDHVGDRRPEQRPAEEEHEHPRRAHVSATSWQTSPATSMTPSVKMMSFVRHRGDSLARGCRTPCAGRVTARVGAPYDDPVLIFILLGWVPWPLLLALAVVMWLTVVELLEWRPHYVWWFWWLLLVFMTNFIGYLFLRAYRVYRRYKLERA